MLPIRTLVQKIRALLKALISSQIIIAISALCLAHETCILADVAPFSWLLSIFVFISSLFIYDLACMGMYGRSGNDRYSLNRPLLLLFFVAVLLLFFLPIHTILLSLTGGVMCIMYIYKIRFRKFVFEIRNIPLLKNLWLAIIWALLTVWVPLSFYHHPIGFHDEAGYLFLRRFFFILAIAIPYDIRDYRKDQANRLQTLPVTIGIQKTKMIAIIALICFTGLVFQTSWNSGDGNVMIHKTSLAFYISIFITGIIILFTNTRKKKYFYSLVLDGTMILQFMLVLLFLKTSVHDVL